MRKGRGRKDGKRRRDKRRNDETLEKKVSETREERKGDESREGRRKGRQIYDKRDTKRGRETGNERERGRRTHPIYQSEAHPGPPPPPGEVPLTGEGEGAARPHPQTLPTAPCILRGVGAERESPRGVNNKRRRRDERKDGGIAKRKKKKSRKGKGTDETGKKIIKDETEAKEDKTKLEKKIPYFIPYRRNPWGSIFPGARQ